MDRSFETMEATTDPPDAVVKRGRGKPLTGVERQTILQALLARQNGKNQLQHGAIGSIAKEFHLSRSTVSSLWKRGLESLQHGASFMEVSSRKKNCGRKKKDYDHAIASLSTVALCKRGTLASTAQAINVPKTVLFRRLKEGEIRVHNSSIKPFLTDDNKAGRVRFCRQRANIDQQLFDPMMDTVHIDEKWFYLTKPSQKCYLGSDEQLPYRSCKSKRFITKVKSWN